MARIRTIKPEFWSSPGVTEMNPWARLAFIAMWNWADDFGRGTYEPRELMGFIFPREDDMTVKEFRQHVGEIHLHVGVMFYTVDGRPYFEIGTWKKHQKTDPRLKQSKYPGPDEGVLIDPVSMQVISGNGETRQHVDVLHPHVDETHQHVGAGTGEQGNRGTGEEEIKDLSDSDESNEPKTPKRNNYSPEFEDWWKRFPKRTGSKKNASVQFKAALKRISLEELNAATDRLAAFVAAGHRDVQFVKDAERWLKGDLWEEELIAPATATAAAGNTLAAWGAPSTQPETPGRDEWGFPTDPFANMRHIIEHQEEAQ